MQIYDSAKKQKVEFIPLNENLVKIYLCGPTVYDDAHLGHAKSAISFDLLRRVLLANNKVVEFARNFTDIDDKILLKMQKENKSLEEITNFYINSYLKDMKELNILEPTFSIKATSCIKDMIEFIKELLKKDVAYKLSDGIYFDTSKDDKYLSLSNRFDTQNKARVKNNDNKKNEKDFALWKFDENFYDAPFGRGRPGWHTECVVMIKKFLCPDCKDQKYCIDIHAGGIDLLFPHHENEAAQFRTCFCGEELAKYWMHNGFVQIDNEKMSKSLGNGFLIKDALKQVNGEALRYYLQGVNYRLNFNFSINDLINSKKRLDRIYRLKKELYSVKIGEVDKEFKQKMLDALNDDLNVSLAYAIVDEMINYAFDNLNNKNELPKFRANLEFIKDVLGILYLDAYEYFQFGVSKEEKDKINSLIQKRLEAKRDKNFALADAIREDLKKNGINLLDLKDKTIWEKSYE